MTDDKLALIETHARDYKRAGMHPDDCIASRADVLALVNIAKAAQGIAECDDYWDWVTGYAPALREALSALGEEAWTHEDRMVLGEGGC